MQSRTRTPAQAKIQLKRKDVASLLGTVNGQPVARATQARQSSPSVGTNDSPISSDDEAELAAAVEPTRRTNKQSSPLPTPTSQRTSPRARKSTASYGMNARIRDEAPLPDSAGGGSSKKRKRESAPEQSDDIFGDEDFLWHSQLGSSQRPAKNRLTYSRGNTNIHAPPTASKGSQKPVYTSPKRDTKTGTKWQPPRELDDPAGAQTANSKRPVFIKPAPLEDEDDFPYNSSPNSPISSQDAPFSSLDLPSQEDASSTTVTCPVCKAHVERSFADTFKAGQKRLHTRQLLKFCTAHKRQTAAAEWQERGYPAIDWETLPKRLRRHNKSMDNVLQQRAFSPYRAILEDRVDTPEFRNGLRAATGSERSVASPGYYGPHGQAVMMNHLIQAFGRKMSTLSAKDPLLAKVGVSAFVQFVLVRELACLLIAEDLDVDLDGARAVLEESAAVGELVNADEEEASGPRGERGVLELGR